MNGVVLFSRDASARRGQPFSTTPNVIERSPFRGTHHSFQVRLADPSAEAVASEFPRQDIYRRSILVTNIRQQAFYHSRPSTESGRDSVESSIEALPTQVPSGQEAEEGFRDNQAIESGLGMEVLRGEIHGQVTAEMRGDRDQFTATVIPLIRLTSAKNDLERRGSEIHAGGRQ